MQKRQEIQNKKQKQCKEAIHTLNKELMAITEKLKKESRLQEKAQKAKESLETKLMTLREQTKKAKVDAVMEFKASQPFINLCAIYYGDGFKDCLKQVGSIYPNLDLSKIYMEDPLPTTPASGDSFSEETNDSTHTEQDPKDDGVVLAQPTVEGPVAPLVPSARTLLQKTPRILQPKMKRTFYQGRLEPFSLVRIFNFLVSHCQTILSALLFLGLVLFMVSA